MQSSQLFARSQDTLYAGNFSS